MRILTNEAGEEQVLISLDEYEDLVDASEARRVRRELADGRTEFLSDSEVDDYLAAPSPLAYWRKRRGVSAAELAGFARIGLDELAALEAGTRSGDVTTFARLARRLRVQIDSIAPVERAAATAAAAE